MTSNEISIFFKSDKEISQINDVREAREMAEQLRPYTTFVNNPSSVHRTQSSPQPLENPVPRDLMPSLASIFTCPPHNCIQIYIIKKRSFLKEMKYMIR